MAQADIAYAATAGAAGLALAVSAWAWRLRARLEARTRNAEASCAALEAAASRASGLIQAFDDISLALDAEGGAAREILGPAELVSRWTDGAETPAAALLERLRPSHGAAIDALVAEGRAFEGLALLDEVALDAASPWRIEGRVAGGLAWLRLAPASSVTLTGPEAIESGLALLADASPTPTWVADGAGLLAWANRAFLEEIGAETLETAQAGKMSFDRGADALVAEARRLGGLQ
ncbi:two-component sensor histidine kinase, partial [Rhodospirillum rubrum]|nr:two-component sensor histidine kinase [Rhodospirillum rubrum]